MPDSQKTQLRLGFTLFADSFSKLLPVAQLSNLLRGMGVIITEEELYSMTDSVGKEQITYEECLAISEEKITQSGSGTSKHDVAEALKVLDNNPASVRKKKFIKAMTTCGEPLTKEQVDSILEGLSTNEDGRIKIDDIVKKIY